MKTPNIHINQFFKDDKGNVVLFQMPNVLLWTWIVLVVVNTFFLHSKYHPVLTLTKAVIFAWAYSELRGGVNMFRKTLGAVVLVLTVVSLFMRNG